MRLINILTILRFLSTILIIETVAFLLCLPVSIIYNETPDPFLWSASLSGFLYLIFRILSRNADTERISNRDGFLTVTLSWFIFALLGSLPYIFSGATSSFPEGFFEAASGFTTTGATIFPDVEILPHSILFWRSFTHWIGGIGIIVLVIIILPSLKITAQLLLSLESSLKEKIHPRTKAIGIRLLAVYMMLTILEILFLARGEMSLFESICHSFGTVATGGFSTKNDSIISYSAYSQYVIAVFMFLSGVSFVVYYYIIKLQFHKLKNNDEIRFYTGTVLVGGIIAGVILFSQTARPLEQSFREGFFQVISFITTTGFITTDYLYWPQAGMVLLFILLFAGASTGSSTGSIKMARHLIVLKNIRNVFIRILHPNVITQIRMNKKTIPENVNITIISFVILYMFIFLTGTVLVVLTGTDILTSASGVASTLGNVGPALGTLGPIHNYSHMPGISLLIFSILMIIGRLEILTVFVLFSRSFWKL